MRTLHALKSVLLVAALGLTVVSSSTALAERRSRPAVASAGQPAAGSTGSAAPTSVSPYAVSVDETAPAPAPAVAPVRLQIPAIGVDTPLAELTADANGILATPTDFDTAAWYVGGPTPGQTGPAVMVGHVDSRAGPAVFYRLIDLVAGHQVLVTLVDRRVLTFTVVGTEMFAKDAFPATLVYGPTPDPQLRLITCGGEFDAPNRNYLSNIVVSAVFTT